MKITVTGKQIDVGAALQQYVEERLGKSVKKYFERALTGDVVFSKQGHLFEARIHVDEGVRSGITVVGEAKADDIYAAFDAASDRIEKQLRRYKKRITNHHQNRSKGDLLDAMNYIIAPELKEDEQEADAPVIVAENNSHIEILSVGEAVMKMDLQSLPALMFINSVNNRINMVYQRSDGNISWVDPREQEQQKAS